MNPVWMSYDGKYVGFKAMPFYNFLHKNLESATWMGGYDQQSGGGYRAALMRVTSHKNEEGELVIKYEADFQVPPKHFHDLIQGATKKHARLRPFPFLCEILIQFHEKIIKFDQIFVKQKIRV